MESRLTSFIHSIMPVVVTPRSERDMRCWTMPMPMRPDLVLLHKSSKNFGFEMRCTRSMEHSVNLVVQAWLIL